MRPYDSLVPYVLASMHPLLHMSMLFTSLIMIGLGKEEFYEVAGTCPPNSQAAYFMTEGKYWFMFWFMSAHLFSIVAHYMY